MKFLLRFDQNVKYKCPTEAYPLHDFQKMCTVCTRFQDALAVKIWLDLLKELWSSGYALKCIAPLFSMHTSVLNTECIEY